MVAQETLITPFESWHEGLLNLADALDSADRTEVMIARLEATARTTKITLNDVCALALLARSSARFDQSTLPRFEPHPTAVLLAKRLGGEFDRIISARLDYIDNERDRRELAISSAFPESDPRRLFKDTIFGFAAAELSDSAQKMGDADPFTRLAHRLSLWFRPSYDFRRYGLCLPENGLAIARTARKLIDTFQNEFAERLGTLIDIWSGEISVKADKENIEKIFSQLSIVRAVSIGGLDNILALETLAELSKEVDKLDIETTEALSQAIEAVYRATEDGSPATTDFRKWIVSQAETGETLKLAFDPFSVMGAIQYGDHLRSFDCVLKKIAGTINRDGIATFDIGPFPIMGSYLRRDSDLFDTFCVVLPEAADLWLLVGSDGDYGDLEEPFAARALWTGEHEPDAITIPDIIDRAAGRGDFALCDILIGVWLLYCGLSKRVPLPDIHGLARRINSLPGDFRSSTYAAVATLKREILEAPRRFREIQSLLSWLPIVEAAPAENFESYLQDVFSSSHWQKLSSEERRRLLSAEESFHILRRQMVKKDGDTLLRLVVMEWSSAAEPILRRVAHKLGGQKPSESARQTLGNLLEVMCKRRDLS